MTIPIKLKRAGLSLDYNHFMLDVETTGMRPDRHAITSVAIVQFDPVDFHGIKHTYHGLVPPPGREFDAPTMKWRIDNGVPQQEKDLVMLSNMFAWVTELHKWLRPDNREPMIWAKPAYFDVAFLESYIDMYGAIKLFHYRNVRDLRSYTDGMGWNLSQIEGVVDAHGPKHNALVDCKFQIACLHHAFKLSAML